MRFGSELLIFIFDLKKEWACLCSPILQNPTGQDLIQESDGPSRQTLAQKSDDSTHRIIKSKKGIGL